MKLREGAQAVHCDGLPRLARDGERLWETQRPVRAGFGGLTQGAAAGVAQGVLENLLPVEEACDGVVGPANIRSAMHGVVRSR